MIQISIDSLDKLLKQVDEGKEVHIEFTPDVTRVEVMPWKPFEYTCPYERGKQDE